MMTSPRASRSMILLVAVVLAGCAGDPPPRYYGVSSASQMTVNTGKEADKIPYRFVTRTDWKKYHNIIIDPVTVNQGADNQFGDLPQSDRQELARYMQNKFAATLRERFVETTGVTPGTLRLKLTLTGAATTTQVVGTVTKFDLAGGPYNIVQSIRGGRGMFSGSVNYAAEIYDASTNQLLESYITHQYPNAMNIGATFGSMSAAEAGVDKGADQLLELLK